MSVAMIRAWSTALFLFTGISRAAESSSTKVPQTKNYIDTISGYDELYSCAVSVLSTIVRDEVSGCQDTYALTSYTCFCTDSSSYFSNVISRDVVAGCEESVAAPQATSALGVFDAYCALGVAAGLVTAQNSPTSAGSASPAAGAPTSSPTQASDSASASSSQNQSGHVPLGTAIGAGVGVAVGIIGLAFAIWFLWRRRYHRAKEARAQNMTAADGVGYRHGIKSGSGGSNEMATYEHHVGEIQGHGLSEAPAIYRPHELSGSYPLKGSNK